jgi:hypothetical protein
MIDRRLLVIGVLALTLALAGCMGGNGGDGNASADDGPDTGADAGDGEGDGEGAGTNGEASLEDVRFGGIYGTADEFAFEVEVKEMGRTMSGRYAQGDRYMRFETDQGPTEFYAVDDEQYIVMTNQDMCIKNPGQNMEPSEEGQVSPGEYDSTVEDYPDLTPTGTTTIDGVQVYIFELQPDMTGQSETVTYYVAVDSGNLRRVETPSAVVDFHSWGDVDPIEAPDMECQDFSDMQNMPSGNGGFPSGGFGG